MKQIPSFQWKGHALTQREIMNSDMDQLTNFSRTIRLISVKPGTLLYWIKEFNFVQKKCLYNALFKNALATLKDLFFLKTHWANFTQALGRSLKFLLIKDHVLFQGEVLIDCIDCKIIALLKLIFC